MKHYDLKWLFDNDRVLFVDRVTFERYIRRPDVVAHYWQYPPHADYEWYLLQNYLGLSYMDAMLVRKCVCESDPPIMLVEDFNLPRFTVKSWRNK